MEDTVLDIPILQIFQSKSFFISIITIVCFQIISCNNNNKTVKTDNNIINKKIYLPENYIGKVTIVYNISCGRTLNIINNTIQIDVPENGIVTTPTLPLKKNCINFFYYGNNKIIPLGDVTKKDTSGNIFIYNEGVFGIREVNGIKYSYETFYVGDRTYFSSGYWNKTVLHNKLTDSIVLKCFN